VYFYNYFELNLVLTYRPERGTNIKRQRNKMFAVTKS